MKQILLDIVSFFVAIGSSIGSVFANMEIYLFWVIVLYIITIIVLVFWLQYSRKTFLTVSNIFNISIDNLYYQTSLLLYNHKDNIYNFKENSPLLLQYKTQEISKRDKANYYSNYPKLIEEIEYI